MRFPLAPALALLLAACGGGHGRGGLSSSVECVPYARQHSGVQLYGDAADWWERAQGRYERTATPAPGAVLVFRRSGRLPHGHVSVVRAQRSAREITVDQANWVHGRITSSEPVLDVSRDNDWSQVRVWWDPSGTLGATTYATYGFVGP